MNDKDMLQYVMEVYSKMVDTLLKENERLKEELRKKTNQ